MENETLEGNAINGHPKKEHKNWNKKKTAVNGYPFGREKNEVHFHRYEILKF